MNTGREGSGIFSKQDPEELVIQLRGGSLIAFRLVRERVRRILHFRGYRMSTEERKDLEQEIMVQIWQAVNRSSFDPRAGFWGFVEVVSVRRSIDWLRTRKPTSVLDERMSDPGVGPQGSLLHEERARLANAALGRLGPQCRELVQLHFGHQKPYRELSRHFGKSEGALRVQMYRCIRQVRAILDEMTAVTRRDNSTAEGP